MNSDPREAAVLENIAPQLEQRASRSSCGYPLSSPAIMQSYSPTHSLREDKNLAIEVLAKAPPRQKTSTSFATCWSDTRIGSCAFIGSAPRMRRNRLSPHRRKISLGPSKRSNG